ncbi:hypothetical protein F5Y05DRAFT_406901 [Hypoxylon sp. FL0543]|nr:hypothetical protein F5Y05DRAFT_406901 [Hypoxylon sp. FL0543]
MADFSWLRLGQRSRTPGAPRSAVPPESGPSNISRRLSQASRSSLSLEPLEGNSNADMLVREHDKTWHNPSLEQMVEALQVKIMSQGALQPIPVEYNSYILHLIEGFAKAQKRIRALDDARAEAKYALDHHLHHFKSTADEWMEREREYKSEVKRLEVLLSRTSRDGLEAVTLARTNSVVDRNGPQATKFISKLKHLSNNAKQGKLTPDAPFDRPKNAEKGRPSSMARILDNDNDFLMSEKIRRNTAASKATIVRPERRRAHYERALSPRPSKNVSVEGREAAAPKALPKDAKLLPLFSDEVYDIPGINGEVETRPGESVPQKEQARRQILENLLDHEGLRGISKDASLSKDIHEHLSSCELDQMRKGAAPGGRNSKHLRGLSEFSFLPGDDTSAFTGSQTDNETAVGAITRKYDDDGVELWRRKPENAVESSSEQTDDEQVSGLAAPLRSWENRQRLTSENALPRDPSTSSTGILIQWLSPLLGRQHCRRDNAPVIM